MLWRTRCIRIPGYFILDFVPLKYRHTNDKIFSLQPNCFSEFLRQRGERPLTELILDLEQLGAWGADDHLNRFARFQIKIIQGLGDYVLFLQRKNFQ